MNIRSFPIAGIVALSVLSAAAIATNPVRAQTAAAQPVCVQLEVQNVRPEQGMLMIAGYGDAASFSKTPLVATQMRASTATMGFPVCGVGATAIAFTLFQDLNGNGKLDRNPFGMPTEPWGASGKPAAMSAPTWETTSVPLDGSTIVVKLSK